jgi:hypothetical protein
VVNVAIDQTTIDLQGFKNLEGLGKPYSLLDISSDVNYMKILDVVQMKASA